LQVKRIKAKLPHKNHIIIIPGNPAKRVSFSRFSMTAMRLMTLFWIAVLTLSVLYCVSLHNKNRELAVRLYESNSVARKSTDSSHDLELEYAELEEKYNRVSDALYTKTQEEEALIAEVEKKKKPSGFPVSGTVAIEEGITQQEGQSPQPALLFDVAEGLFILASGDGVVAEVSADPTYTNKIIVDHDNGYKSIYRYAGSPMIKIGAQVVRGTPLYAAKSDLGKAAYNVMQNDIYIDPMSLMEVSG